MVILILRIVSGLLDKNSFLFRISSPEDLTGQKFGNLIVVRKIIQEFGHHYESQCICGKIRISEYSDLKYGKHSSCGCQGKLYQWSKNYPNCVLCNRTKSPHACKGYCKQCYDQLKKNPDYQPAEH